MRENRPQKKHPKGGFNGMPKDTLNRSHGPISLNEDDCHVYTLKETLLSVRTLILASRTK